MPRAKCVACATSCQSGVDHNRRLQTWRERADAWVNAPDGSFEQWVHWSSPIPRRVLTSLDSGDRHRRWPDKRVGCRAIGHRDSPSPPDRSPGGDVRSSDYRYLCGRLEAVRRTDVSRPNDDAALPGMDSPTLNRPIRNSDEESCFSIRASISSDRCGFRNGLCGATSWSVDRLRAWIKLQFLRNSGSNLSQIPVPVPKIETPSSLIDPSDGAAPRDRESDGPRLRDPQTRRESGLLLVLVFIGIPPCGSVPPRSRSTLYSVRPSFSAISGRP